MKNNSTNLFELMPQGEQAQRILDARADLFSTEVTASSKSLPKNHYLCFRLGEESYGIPYQYIKEVLFNVNPTKVPHTPDYILGVINRDGELLTVLDLKSFFRIKSATVENKSHLIVVQAQGITLVVLAESIEDAVDYDPIRLEPPLVLGGAINPNYILGLDLGTVAIINMDTLLGKMQSKVSDSKESIG